MAESTALTFPGDPRRPDVEALWLRPRGAVATYVFAHGAGAGMHHRFMERYAQGLAEHGVATLRYMFPYMQAGSRRPDARSLLLATVRAAVAVAVAKSGDLPVFAGGKSMGGRMTSTTSAAEPLPGVDGLVFVGFPLHPAGKPGIERADHLSDVALPMLFVQGTRDRLADLSRLRPVLEPLADRATLHIVEGGDHGLDVLKRSGRSDEDVLEEVAQTIRTWIDTQLQAAR